MRHCTCAHIHKRRHFQAKTTSASFKCIKKWGQGIKSPEFCAKGATRTLTRLSRPKHIPACRSEFDLRVILRPFRSLVVHQKKRNSAPELNNWIPVKKKLFPFAHCCTSCNLFPHERTTVKCYFLFI